MPRITARERRKVAVKLTSMTDCQSSSVRRIDNISRVNPALFTRTSMLPIASSARPIRPSTDSASERFAGVTCAFLPNSEANAERASSRVPDSAILAPAPWRARAIAPPIPPEAPVISADFPVRSNITISPRGFQGTLQYLHIPELKWMTVRGRCVAQDRSGPFQPPPQPAYRHLYP